MTKENHLANLIYIQKKNKIHTYDFDISLNTQCLQKLQCSESSIQMALYEIYFWFVPSNSGAAAVRAAIIQSHESSNNSIPRNENEAKISKI